MDFFKHDALILRTMCSVSEKNPVDLEHIIAMADSIEHLILNHWDVDTGLDRLIQAGYVRFRDDKFFVSHEVREFSNTKLNGVGPLKQTEKLGKFLNIDYSKPKRESSKFGSEKVISIAEFNKAVEQYLNRFNS